MNRSRVTGDLASHGNIFVDIANDRVGIGSTIPGEKLSLPDDAKISLGDSTDFKIYHNTVANTTSPPNYLYPNSNYIDSVAAQNLFIRTSTAGIYLGRTDGAHAASFHTNTAGVVLYYDASGSGGERFRTKDYGINVTGTTDTDGLVVSGVTTTNQLKFADSNGSSTNIALFGDSNDLKIYHNGSHSIVQETGSGGLLLLGSVIELGVPSGSEKYFRAVENGAAELYFNNELRLKTQVNHLELYGNASESNVEFFTVSSGTNYVRALIGVTNNGTMSFYTNDGTQKMAVNLVPSGAVELKHNASTKFATTSSGISVTGQGVFSAAITASTYIQGTSSNGGLKFYSDSSTSKGVVLDTNDHLVPTHDSNSDLGLTGTRWRNVYADTLYGDGSNLTGIDTDLVSDTSPQLGGDLDANSKNIFFGDSSSSSNNRIQFGTTDKDLQIYHDGSHSRIAEGGTGNLILSTNGGTVSLYNTSNSEDLAKFISNGAVELYHNGNKKFETNAAGILVTGNITAGDSQQLQLGANGDLRAFHDGSNSYIDNNMGDLYIQTTSSGDDIFIEAADDFQVSTGGETAILAVGDGEVQLYHNNAKKFETQSGGTLTTGVHSVSSSIRISGEIDLGTANGNKFMDACLGDNYTFFLRSTSGEGQNHENLAKFTRNGSVELFYDAGLRFATDSGGCTITGGVDSTTGIFERTNNGTSQLQFSASNETKLKHLSNSQCKLSFVGYNNVFGGSIDAQTDQGYIRIKNGADEQAVMCRSNGAVELYHDNSKKFETASHGISVHGEVRVGNLHINYLGGGTHWWTQADSGITYFRNQSGTIRTQILGSGHWRWNDNYKVQLGNGDDLQLYHDGSSSYVSNTTGNLYIESKAGETAIQIIPDGAVDLRHNGTKKLETTSTGVTFNGTGAILLPKGTTAQRPTGANGHVRYNETTNALEGYINGGWVTVKATGLAEDGGYANNTQATADDLWAYWDCDSTSTTRAGGDSGAATLYGVTSQGGKISNSWDRGTSHSNGVLLTSMPTSNNFTLMFQLYRTDSTIHSSSDGAAIVHLDGALSGGTEGSVILGYDGSNGTDLRFGGNGWVNDGETVLGNFSNNNWYHMVITRSSGTTWKFYLDGSLITTRTETMTVGSSWMLGNYGRVNGNGNSNNHYFRGRFDEIAVWDRTLSAAEISSIYTAQDAGTALL